MEIQNLRLQLLHIANGDVEKAQAMEAYVLAKEAAEVNVNMNAKAVEPKSEECGCLVCFIEKAIKEQNIKF